MVNVLSTALVWIQFRVGCHVICQLQLFVGSVSTSCKDVDLLHGVIAGSWSHKDYNGIGRQGCWISVILYQFICIHLLYLLGHYPGELSYLSFLLFFKGLSHFKRNLLLIPTVFVLQPFVNSDHFIHRYFLPQEYAILIPVFAGMVLLCFLCMFIGYVMLKSKKKKAWCIYLLFFDILEMNCWNTTFCRDFVNGPSLLVG